MPLADLIAIGFAVIGLCVLIYCGRLLSDAWATQEWPTAEAQILEAEVEESKDSEGDCRAAYDPEYPTSAVLEPGVHWPLYMGGGVGLTFFLMGVAGYLHLMALTE